ncbi:E3 ubiquitin-protein ligase TRIM39-like [Boleophthalmus pectinirostris]|uniref:E3 ubiquitin-protein ligase TRIM39-like n=1 Tax=Boleophthalmus pectinirostris TaxID=150288 RepID=UPI000A1C4469|nr:E3 ubiquitin-protein ligase TRIM39-like [Boleophthalmus pectinirostris]
MSGAFLEDQFRCSICLDIFKNPVSIPCGHNFCLGCVRRFWDTRSKAECPLCKETFKNRPDLRVNVVLRDCANEFRRISKPRVKPNPTPPPRRHVPKQISKSDDVFCDMCVKEGVSDRTQALKSCLVCRESYCELHLGPHLRDPVLTRHMLTDPGTFTSSHTCRKHNHLLHMFCQREHLLVCPKCTKHDHKYHEVVPIDVESRRVRNEMKKAEADFHHMIQARTKKIQEIKNSLDVSRKQKEEELQRTLQVYSTVKSAIESHQGALIMECESKQEELARRAQDLQKELNQEVNEIQRRRGEMHQLELVDDPLHLIQSFPALMVPTFTNDLSQMKLQPSSSISAVRNAFSKMVDFCLELQKQLTAEEVSMMTQYAVDVTLDPVTAAGWLILSADGKKVSVSLQQRRSSLYDDPKRFDSCVSVLGKQSFTTGRHYWVVQVGEKTDWDLGIAKESINRKGAITVRPDCGFWAICRRKGGCLSACTSPSVPIPLLDTPQSIAIFLDYEQDEVSFYDAENKVHIYTFSECGFNEPLYPYFNPCLLENGKNAGPLIIVPVETVITGGKVIL